MSDPLDFTEPDVAVPDTEPAAADGAEATPAEPGQAGPSEPGVDTTVDELLPRGDLALDDDTAAPLAADTGAGVASAAPDVEPDVLAERAAVEDTAVAAATADDTSTADDTAADTSADAAEVVDAEELIAERPPRESPYDRPGNWYVVHTQSGYEKKVKSNLESRIVSMDIEDSIFEVVIPMEDVIEFKGGKKVVVQKKVFPGYLYVRCYLDDRSWEVIRNTPGVTGFVGTGGKPLPLTRRDVEMALSVPDEAEDDAAAPKRGRPRLEYEVGETVRIKEGAFADFTGEIAEINEDQLNLKVLVNIFGRETPITIEFSHVAKL